MKRPSWATAIGIIGILFGALGIIGGIQEMMMPKMLQMQKEMFKTFANAPHTRHEHPAPIEAPRGLADMDPKNSTDNAPTPPAAENPNKPDNQSLPNPAFPQQIEKMFDVPDWFGSWSVAIGIAKMIVSGFYLFASIWLLMLKPTSIKLFYWAVGASILLGVVKAIVGISALSFMVMAMMMGGLFGVVIDVVMIVVVALSDKTAYLPNQQNDELKRID